MSGRHLPLFLAALALSCSPRGEVLVEEWYRLEIDGSHAGSSHRITRRLDDGTIQTMLVNEMAIRRQETTIEVETRLTTREKANGAFLGFEMANKLSEGTITMSGVVDGEIVRVTTSGRGPKRQSTVPFDDSARGPYWIELATAKALKGPRDEFSAVSFMPEANRCATIEAVAGEGTRLSIDGVERDLLEVKVTTDALPGIVTTSWIDKSGVAWKSSRQAMGMTFQEIKTTRERARRGGGAAAPEIFVTTSIRPDIRLRDPNRADSIVYRFRLREGDFASRGLRDAFRGTGQTLEHEENPSTRVVRIQVVEPESAVPLSRDKLPDEARAALAPNAFIQSDDPEILAAAKGAIGSTTDAWEAAKRLETWVSRTVRARNLNTAFASAKETLERREGDCTELGVLLAATARAVGIPARVVTGLVYYNGAFMGHLWTEVWIDRWVPLDATRPRGRVGPDHIGLKASNLDDANATAVFLDLASLLGNLEIEIVEQ